MRHQMQEMLYIEKGGEAQIADELAAYNPLIPQGSELVATVMFEIDDPVRRARVLAELGGMRGPCLHRGRRRAASAASPTRRARTPARRARPRRCSSSASRLTPAQVAAFKARAPGCHRLRPPELRAHGRDFGSSPRDPRRGFRLGASAVRRDRRVSFRSNEFLPRRHHYAILPPQKPTWIRGRQ